MPQHFKNNAEQAAAMKRSRKLITGVLIILGITIGFIAFQFFI